MALAILGILQFDLDAVDNDDSKKELPLPRQDDLESLFGLIDDR